MGDSALAGRGRSHRVWPSKQAVKIIRSIAEASEVTRQWRTLNISKSQADPICRRKSCVARVLLHGRDCVVWLDRTNGMDFALKNSSLGVTMRALNCFSDRHIECAFVS